MSNDPIWYVTLRTGEFTKVTGSGSTFTGALRDAREKARKVRVRKPLGYHVTHGGKYVCHSRFQGWDALRNHVGALPGC
jgi:hypothetical protein